MGHVLETLWDRVTGMTRVTLTETERMLVLEDGRVTAILGAGRHRVKRDARTEVHNIDLLRMASPHERALWRTRPELAAAHLVEVAPLEGEVALVSRDGVPVSAVRPYERAVYWRDAGALTVERVAYDDTLMVAAPVLRRLLRVGLSTAYTLHEVHEGHVGMLHVDGVLVGRLSAGTHASWKLGRSVAVKAMDLRVRVHEATGQEVLTRDRVTVRVNLSAVYRVTDAERAVTAVKDVTEALHRALQLAYRRKLGALTLDRLLEEKGSLDSAVAAEVRAEMVGLGLEVTEVALKDVVLPGEMRELLNRVVAAEKEAEANVIRRREETNATRALLNTAKVMAENPVMLRLKELEALESVAGKVERLTVLNGTEGLLSDVVRLRD
ncbi:slipin family protein [Mesobacterium pallidum]|uniref:slipin family protein n=1 Tax=Mesobacterium pallidum TaxID=2872037 RepID=UPI001EE30324|nr:slipin family protein [Mesobacterium pallidum]